MRRSAEASTPLLRVNVDGSGPLLRLSPEGLRLLGAGPMVTIAGPMRTGKSLLLSYISGKQGLFQSANQGACTKGVDVAVSSSALGTSLVYADVEGQGDAAMDHDFRLTAPMVIASQVFIYNTKSLSTKKVLEQLELLLKIASDGSTSGELLTSHKLGHFIVVVRDYTQGGSSSYWHEQFFSQEAIDEDEDEEYKKAIRRRNSTRSRALELFTSIEVHLLALPAPSEQINQHASLPHEYLSATFALQANALQRSVMAKLARPVPLLGLTTPQTAMLVERAVAVLNDGASCSIIPELADYLDEEVAATATRAAIEAGKASMDACIPTLPMKQEKLTALCDDAIISSLDRLRLQCARVGVLRSRAAAAAARDALRSHAAQLQTENARVRKVHEAEEKAREARRLKEEAERKAREAEHARKHELQMQRRCRSCGSTFTRAGNTSSSCRRAAGRHHPGQLRTACAFHPYFGFVPVGQFYDCCRGGACGDGCKTRYTENYHEE